MSAPAKTVHRCALCNRRLKEGQWVYSRHTGNRFCLDCSRTGGRR